MKFAVSLLISRPTVHRCYNSVQLDSVQHCYDISDRVFLSCSLYIARDYTDCMRALYNLSFVYRML